VGASELTGGTEESRPASFAAASSPLSRSSAATSSPLAAVASLPGDASASVRSSVRRATPRAALQPAVMERIATVAMSFVGWIVAEGIFTDPERSKGTGPFHGVVAAVLVARHEHDELASLAWNGWHGRVEPLHYVRGVSRDGKRTSRRCARRSYGESLENGGSRF
jgi:hypothetical protein